MKRTINIFAFLFAVMFSAYAGNVVVNPEGSTLLDVRTNTYEVMSFRNTISDIHFFEVGTKEGVFTQLQIEDYGYSLEVGNPKLPVLKQLFEVPVGAEMKVNITASTYKEYSLKELGITNFIIPAQKSVEKARDPYFENFVINTDTYQKNELLGQELVSVKYLGEKRAQRMARLEIAPIQYNPATGIIRVYDKIDAKIEFIGADIQATIQHKKELASPYYAAINSKLINNNFGAKELITTAPATYIIVSDPMFEDALQAFVDWKTKKGFNVVLALTNDPNVGNSTTSIHDYLQNFYDNPPTGYSPQTFVLLVGDVAQIPTYSGTSGGHVSDLYYMDYTGDIYPECYYGRFSATTLTELQPQIDKTLEHEQFLFPNSDFLGNVLMVSGVDSGNAPTYGNGQINYGTENYYNAEHAIYSHTILYPHSADPGITDSIITYFNEGISFANYTAHCGPSGWADPSFEISNIPSLTNEHMYPLVVGNCCSSVEFQTTCFGEEMLRADGKGALGYIGGSNSTYWDEDYWWGVGFKVVSANPVYEADHLGSYDRMFHDHGESIEDWYITQDQMLQGGNLAVTQSGSTRETYYYEIYHLMGDPSLMVYFGVPPMATATFSGLMPLGAETFTVNTNPYALVAISKDGVLRGAAVADATGLAEVPLTNPITVPGNADIVITGQNIEPFFGTIAVATPEGAYVLFDDVAIDDAAGNGNGNADYHEDVLLDVTLVNFGSETGTNLSATLSTDNTNVTITNNSATWSDIAPNSTGTTNGAFAFTVADLITEGEVVTFDLSITNGTDTWTSNFNISLHAPVISFASYTIDDASGNGNGKLDPGETVNLQLTASNSGSADAFNINGVLSSSNSYITINTSNNDFGNINAGAEATEIFEIEVSPAAPAGDIANFTIGLTADYGYDAEGTFTEVIGQIPVLIIDLDPNTSSGPAIQQAVENNEISVEYMTSFPENLSLYSSIFVCLGIYSDNHVLTDTEGQLLADYLNNGGNLYMEGGDTWAYNSATPVHPMFNISGDEDGSNDLSTVTGQAGTFAEGMEFAYSGENNWIDHISPLNGATLLFKNQAIDYGITIANDANTYKTIGASYEFGGLDDASSPSTKDELMNQYLTFFGLGNAPQPLTASFTASETTIVEGESITFTDYSTGNPTSWEWTFEGGDPATSTDQNPVVTYNDFGSYSVKLIVSNGTNSDTLVKADYIEVETTGINENSISGIEVFPNPFTNQLNVKYYLNENSDVRISILNTLGQEIEVIKDIADEENGQHIAVFNSGQYPEAIYFVNIQTNNFKTVKRVVLTK
jgi:PKD repeat protein